MNKPANIDRRSFLRGSFAAGVLIAAGSACGCSASGDAQSSSGSASPGGASFDFDDSVKAATSFTAEANEAMYALLDFSDENELACAQRGLIAAPDPLDTAIMIDMRMADHHARNRQILNVVADQRIGSTSALATHHGVEHNPTRLPTHERHIGQVITTHLI